MENIQLTVGTIIHSFHKYVLATDCTPGTVLDAGI